MRIGIDSRHLSNRRTGVEYFLQNLLSALARVEHPHEIVLFAEAGQDIAFEMPGARIVRTRPSRVPFFLYRCPRASRSAGVDLFYSPVTAVPLWGVPAVATVYDLLCYRFPGGFPRSYVASQRAWLHLSTRLARRIVVDSENTRRDLLAFFPRARDRARLVTGAADPFFLQAAGPGPAGPALERLGVRKPFVLTVGTLQPRKNLERLIRVFARVRRTGPFPHQLVIAGPEGWMFDDRLSCEARTAEDRPRFTGYVSRDDLRALYREADCFVLPSLYEGFGLPLLEAMACGTPVACSNASSFPEVAGEAARYFDPRDDDSMAEALLAILGDRELRAALVSRGAERVRQFSWESSARAWLRVLEEAADEARRPSA